MRHDYQPGDLLAQALRESHGGGDSVDVEVVRDWRLAIQERARERADAHRQHVRDLVRGGCTVADHDAAGRRIRRIERDATMTAWHTPVPHGFWARLADYLWP